MISEFYFFDQYSHSLQLGRIHRKKRNLQDFNQALYHLKVNLSTDNQLENSTFIQNKNPIQLNSIDKIILPEILIKELDQILINLNKKSQRNSSRSSEQSKSPELNLITNIPKISLPSSLILQLHSTWSDLILNTNYKYNKVWRTKTSEESWREFVKKKRSQQINEEKQNDIIDNIKPIIHRRTSSRMSISSIGNFSHRQSLIINSKGRLSRTFSRASIFSTNSLLKSIHQNSTDNHIETIKNGIHVEFKLSTPNQQPIQKLLSFDIQKDNVNINEDIIIFNQNKCKRLLAETKQKIFETTIENNKNNLKIPRIWFYGDNQFLRNKNETLNQLNRKQKSKFVLSILRHEIPDKYNIDINIPETKRKSYIELNDGSIQIYYPSGRLAVLRLRSPISTTLFYDDIDSQKKQFLGLVTSTGNVLLMQPTFHARFITNNRYESAFLCNGKTGFIEKEFNYNNQRQSIRIDNEFNKNKISLDENTIQFQLNSFMQIEYQNNSNILFAFKCQDEEFQFQLGYHHLIQTPTLIEVTKTITQSKRHSIENKVQILPNKFNSIISNDLLNINQKQTENISDQLNQTYQLPILQDLILLKKRIKHICHSWLKEYRTTLGIMDIDDYCLSDLPKQEIIRRSHTNLTQLPQQISLNNDFVKTLNRQEIITTKFESNVIANAIEKFIPQSDTGRAIKQQIYRKKILPTTTLPVIK